MACVYWTLYRDIEANLARDLWHRKWQEQMTMTIAGLARAFQTIGVSTERTSVATRRLVALLEADTIKRQGGI